MASTSLTNCNVFRDGRRGTRVDVVLDDGRVAYVGDSGSAPSADEFIDLTGRWIAPGMIDLQVNGAGGALFQETPDVDCLTVIAAALREIGVTGFLPTLTVADQTKTFQAADAVGEAIRAGSGSVLGLNLEGPFINPAKAGMADVSSCRSYEADFVREIVERIAPGRLYMTVAPESLGPNPDITLATLAVGHTNADYAETADLFSSGLNTVTHLFNAMTGISGREPGVAGAVLDSDSVRSSLIADGFHVHPANVRLAYSRLGPSRLFLISDAMPPLGSAVTSFSYNEHTVTVRDGRCQTEDGVLAGTAVGLDRAIQNVRGWLDADIATLVPAVTAVPAAVLGLDGEVGTLAVGARANLLVTDENFTLVSTILDGDVSPLRSTLTG